MIDPVVRTQNNYPTVRIVNFLRVISMIGTARSALTVLALAWTTVSANAEELAESRAVRLAAMVKEHRLKAEALSGEAARRKAGHAGTAFATIGSEDATCAALAYLFGKDDIFKRLSPVEEMTLEPQMSEGDLQALSITAIWHGNWADAVESVLSETPRNRIELWNLNCVRQHDIGVEHTMARLSPAAEFEVRGDQLHVLGDIDRGFFARFQQELAANHGVKVVVLGSGGGSVGDAIRSALLIRKRQLDTTLGSDCYSACPLIFLGGVNRSIWSPYPRLGFHQVSRDGAAVPLSDDVYGLIGKVAHQLGANSQTLLSLMHSASPEKMTYPEVWNLCDSGITTWVQRGC